MQKRWTRALFLVRVASRDQGSRVRRAGQDARVALCACRSCCVLFAGFTVYRLAVWRVLWGTVTVPLLTGDTIVHAHSQALLLSKFLVLSHRFLSYIAAIP